jgi:Flp pilus assembly protein TadG
VFDLVRQTYHVRRRGGAVLELALLLPFLCFTFVVAIDYARLFYHYTIVTNCARNGALYGSSASQAAATPYTSISQAALAGAGDLKPQPTVTSTTGSDVNGNPYVQVSVTYPFNLITHFPGMPASVTLNRMVQMRVGP